jgi:hypothetical protein
LHNTSYTSEDFQRSYAVDHLPFCVACHAPQTKLRQTPDAFAAGVDCVTCHAGSEAHQKAPTTLPPPPATCENCHNFETPGARTFLQSTGREHRESSYQSASCTDCHMPKLSQGTPGSSLQSANLKASNVRGLTARHRNHRFDVSRSADVLGQALRVDPPQCKNGAFTFALRTQGVGHKFPTGDVFRALEVHARLEDKGSRILSSTDAFLHRDWNYHLRGQGRFFSPDEPNDTRLTDAPTSLSLEAHPLAAELIVDVVYVRGFEAIRDTLIPFSSMPIVHQTFPITPSGSCATW